MCYKLRVCSSASCRFSSRCVYSHTCTSLPFRCSSEELIDSMYSASCSCSSTVRKLEHFCVLRRVYSRLKITHIPSTSLAKMGRTQVRASPLAFSPHWSQHAYSVHKGCVSWNLTSSYSNFDCRNM